MDPDANVAEQWSIVESRSKDTAQNDRLMDLRVDYSEWQSMGGYFANRSPPSQAEILAAGFTIYKP